MMRWKLFLIGRWLAIQLGKEYTATSVCLIERGYILFGKRFPVSVEER